MRTIHQCFPDGKNKVLTMSYDDGREADIRLIKIFNDNGIKGTFYLNSGYIDKSFNDNIKNFGRRIKEDEIKELYKGHEVATHTVTHPTIARCPISQVVNQIVEDRKKLESIVGYPVRGLSYPNGSYSEEIKNMLPYIDIKYGRIAGSSGNFNMPSDLYQWEATCHHNKNLLELANEFLIKDRPQHLHMFYVWGHSYEFNRDNNWELIEEFSQKMGNRDDIWYATNIEIVDYLYAFNRLIFSMDGSFVYNPSVQSVWVNVDNIVYEIKGGHQVKFK